ncbi:AAA family ATPase [Thiobacter aerophilum]|uniref:AAA family ATPase n=1 Tax=Thiobacter aerophilum TaxID=3121275 RepID=A0ABV0EBC8_9BURK
MLQNQLAGRIPMPDPVRLHQILVNALLDPRRYPHPVERVTRIETHISTVLLAGAFAYKIKKPYDLGFLDFTTLAARRHYCEEELRLNRRFSPELYLAVLPITGSHEDPHLGGEGPAIEYALKMRRFPPGSLLSEAMARGEISEAQIDALACDVAALHQRIAVASPDTPWGMPTTLAAQARQNVEQIQPLLGSDAQRRELQALARWTETELARLEPLIQRRKQEGFVRECHGDMHTGNMVVIDGRIRLFDCIEFNEAFRWIDVMSEVAFLVMDLASQGRPELGWRFLNLYLEQTGDYPGVGVLRYYLVFRAVVRAKVAAFEAAQPGIEEHARLKAWRRYEQYMTLARRFQHAEPPLLIVMHGLSGSGKSTLAARLAERLGAIRLRSDVERKRLFGLKPLERSTGQDIYTAEATRRTYARLHGLAPVILAAGFTCILDATYLKKSERDAARQAARDHAFVILSCQAGKATLRARVATRHAAGTDAAEADLRVLTLQSHWLEPPSADEPVLTVTTDSEIDLEGLIETLRARAGPTRLS